MVDIIKKDVSRKVMSFMKTLVAAKPPPTAAEKRKKKDMQIGPPPFITNLGTMPEHVKNLGTWDQLIEGLIPSGYYSPIDLKYFAEDLRKKYTELYPWVEDDLASVKENEKNLDINDILKIEAMGNETYMTAVFLPCHHDYAKKGKKLEIII